MNSCILLASILISAIASINAHGLMACPPPTWNLPQGFFDKSAWTYVVGSTDLFGKSSPYKGFSQAPHNETGNGHQLYDILKGDYGAKYGHTLKGMFETLFSVPNNYANAAMPADEVTKRWQCGWTDMNSPAVSKERCMNEVVWSQPKNQNDIWDYSGSSGFIHGGPLEIHLNGKIVLSVADAVELYNPDGATRGIGPAHIKDFDYSACGNSGTCFMEVYWIGVHVDPFEFYSNCVNLQMDGSNLPPSPVVTPATTPVVTNPPVATNPPEVTNPPVSTPESPVTQAPPTSPPATSPPSSDTTNPTYPSPNPPSDGKCLKFWQYCQNGGTCTTGSTCKWWVCTPDNYAWGRTCGQGNECPAGYKCREHNKWYSGCEPAEPQC